ncbi:alpha/beta hydrolase [Actinomycetota bacterium]
MESQRIQVADQVAWQHDGEARGGVFHTYDELTLDGDDYGWHKVHVWLPPSYVAGSSRHPVVYANDGRQVFFGGGVGQNWWVQQVVQESGLEGGGAEGRAAALPIVVGVEWRQRSNEYLHEPVVPLRYGPAELVQGGGLERYRDYLVEVIVPFVDANYRTIADRRHRVVLGSSHGGLAAFFIGVTRGDVFGQVIAMSPSFWVGTVKLLRQSRIYELVAEDLRSDTRPRIYLDWGLRRDGGPHNKAVEALATSYGEEMRDVLVRDHGYVEGEDLMAVADPDGEHNEDTWRRRLPAALRFALGE